VFPAARTGDTATHDLLVPSGVIAPPIVPCVLCGARPVLIEGMPAAHLSCSVVCSGAASLGPVHPPPPPPAPPPPIIVGAPTVMIHGVPAARWAPSGDMAACGAFLGDPKLTPARRVIIGNGAAPPRPSKVATTGLGEVVDRFAGLSPSLQKDLQTLLKKGWKLTYGPKGEGSHASRDSKPPTIVVDSAEKGNPVAIMQTISHEAGHAMYVPKDDFSSKGAFVKGALADEGAATLNNVKVQRELKSGGGADVGIAGNPANHPVYNAAYDQFEKDGDAVAARDKIGAQFGDGEYSSVKVAGQHVKYNDYYGGWYDQAFPGKK
jgi:type VI secretion system secreted protein VgrG